MLDSTGVLLTTMNYYEITIAMRECIVLYYDDAVHFNAYDGGGVVPMYDLKIDKDSEFIHVVFAAATTACAECNGDRYILIECCDGRECGCMGQPVSMENCTACNPNGDAGGSEYIRQYADKIEFNLR